MSPDRSPDGTCPAPSQRLFGLVLVADLKKNIMLSEYRLVGKYKSTLEMSQMVLADAKDSMTI